MRRPLLVGCLIVILAVALGIGLPVLLALRKPLTVSRMSRSDPRVRAAIEKSQAGLNGFAMDLASPNVKDHFALMAEFPSRFGPEFLWVKDPMFADGKFTGVLDQQPVAAKLQKGDTVTVDRSKVVDWYELKENGTTRGKFIEAALGSG